MKDVLIGIVSAVVFVFIVIPLTLLLGVGKISWKNIKKMYWVLFR